MARRGDPHAPLTRPRAPLARHQPPRGLDLLGPSEAPGLVQRHHERGRRDRSRAAQAAHSCHLRAGALDGHGRIAVKRGQRRMRRSPPGPGWQAAPARAPGLGGGALLAARAVNQRIESALSAHRRSAGPPRPQPRPDPLRAALMVSASSAFAFKTDFGRRRRAFRTPVSPRPAVPRELIAASSRTTRRPLCASA